MQNRWHRVEPLLREFQECLAKKVTALKIEPATDGKWSDPEYENRPNKDFPSKLRGVYLLFDTNDDLLYVGLATVNFDKRVWSHDKQVKDELKRERRWIDIITFPKEWLFLAPALESFLISRLNPPCNTHLKDKHD